MTTANVNVTKVLLKRGNTVQNNNYTGVSGELTIDTQLKTLRVHDGVTAGGNVITASRCGLVRTAIQILLHTWPHRVLPVQTLVHFKLLLTLMLLLKQPVSICQCQHWCISDIRQFKCSHTSNQH
jgi:hypothetical protein